jgi:hypothetical protein
VSLAGWVPIRVVTRGSSVLLDCCFADDDRLTEPFFDHTVERWLERPCNLLLRREVAIEELVEHHARSSGPALDGLIFHTSRCGSTLVAQLLAELPEVRVISEPSVVDGLLRVADRLGVAGRELAGWLRGVVQALAAPTAGESAAVLKASARHATHLGVYRQAFPETPWVFLYREPREVLVSLAEQPGGLVCDHGDPSSFHAEVLNEIMRAALQHYDREVSRLISYRQLPDAVGESMIELFRLAVDDAARAAAARRARTSAKAPGLAFRGDSDRKRGAVTDAIDRAARRWLDDLYLELEGHRVAADAELAIDLSPRAETSISMEER